MRRDPLPRSSRRLLRIGALLVAALVGLGMSLDAASQNPPCPGEQASQYHKAIYQVILWHLRPPSAVAQEKIPFDAEEFSVRSGRVHDMSHLLAEAYPPESQAGAPTRAKPEIWQNRADFDARLKAQQEKSRALVDTASRGSSRRARLHSARRPTPARTATTIIGPNETPRARDAPLCSERGKDVRRRGQLNRDGESSGAEHDQQ